MDHTYLLAVGWIWVMATISPGPNFLAIAHMAASKSRAAAFAAVGGTGVATAAWGLCGLAGVKALFIAAPWSYTALKIVGAAYLVYVGVKLVARRRASLDANGSAAGHGPYSFRRAFAVGLATGLANPRSALSVASVFAVTLPVGAPLAAGIASILVMVAISMSWYAFVACVVTTAPFVRGYRRVGRLSDKIAGGMLVVMGLKLALADR